MNEQTLSGYWALVDKQKLYGSSENLRFYLDYVFKGVDFSGKRMLDIGAGIGLCSFYGAALGASEVIALEPEAEGSTSGVNNTFADMSANLKLSQVRLMPITFQEFDPGDDKFDVVLLHDSINHLDEPACMNLRRDPSAVESYHQLFAKLAGMTASGGKLIITDASNWNFFAILGMKNPFSPTIEWQKHQSPTLWAGLLSKVGFHSPRVRWATFNRLGSGGRALLGNKTAAFFLQSRFCLTMEKR